MLHTNSSVSAKSTCLQTRSNAGKHQASSVGRVKSLHAFLVKDTSYSKAGTAELQGNSSETKAARPQFCHHHTKAEHTVLLLLCSKTPSLPSEEQQVKSFVRLKGCNGAAFLMTIKTNSGYDSNIRCHGLSPSQERRTQKDSNTH